MRLLFASQNKHKIEEIRLLLLNTVELLSLNDFGFEGEIPETSTTLQGNALQKAQFIYDLYKIPSFADDTGLEVDALDGRPGVYSARYAGEGKSANDNMNKLLAEMQGVSDRTATFKTVIALVGPGESRLFEGEVKGFITKEKHGTKGFGYDPVFMPEGCSITFAEMSMAQKNTLSHRGRAVRKFAEWVKTTLHK